MYDLVLAISAKNEERYISSMLEESQKTLRSITANYKIIVIDVSSTDRTAEIARKIAKSDSKIEIIKRKPRNRGRDIMLAFSKYNSKLYCHTDADMSRNVRSLKKMVNLAKNYDVVVGSKYIDESRIERPVIRHVLSVTYNFMLSLLFNDHIHDHQCGFKLFNRRAFELIKKYTIEPHWTWDTEMLFICVFGGLAVKEFPVDWKDDRNLSPFTNLRRGAKDIADYTVPVLRMFYRFRIAHVVVTPNAASAA